MKRRWPVKNVTQKSKIVRTTMIAMVHQSFVILLTTMQTIAMTWNSHCHRRRRSLWSVRHANRCLHRRRKKRNDAAHPHGIRKLNDDAAKIHRIKVALVHRWSMTAISMIWTAHQWANWVTHRRTNTVAKNGIPGGTYSSLITSNKGTHNTTLFTAILNTRSMSQTDTHQIARKNKSLFLQFYCHSSNSILLITS